MIQRKILLQNKVLKNMTEKITVLEQAAITSLLALDDPSLDLSKQRKMFRGQNKLIKQIWRIKENIENQIMNIDKLT